MDDLARIQHRIGPAFYSTTFTTETRLEQSQAKRGAGLLWEAGITVPPRSQVFGEFLVQYRFVGHVGAGAGIRCERDVRGARTTQSGFAASAASYQNESTPLQGPDLRRAAVERSPCAAA